MVGVKTSCAEWLDNTLSTTGTSKELEEHIITCWNENSIGIRVEKEKEKASQEGIWLRARKDLHKLGIGWIAGLLEGLTKGNSILLKTTCLLIIIFLDFISRQR